MNTVKWLDSWTKVQKLYNSYYKDAGNNNVKPINKAKIPKIINLSYADNMFILKYGKKAFRKLQEFK